MKIKSIQEKRFQILLIILMALIMLLVAYPVWFSFVNSLENAQEISKHGYSLLLPRKISFDSWKAVLSNMDIVNAFLITLSRTLIITVLQTLITAMFAYGFSRNNLIGKKFYTTIGFVSMYLNGGVIAYFIMFNAMHIYNTYWVYILPCLFGGFYNVIIFNANFKAIPESLYESAKIDGASEYRIFFSIVMPLSKPVISALGIFTAVGTWNDYTQTLYYTKSTNLQTLSYYTLSITKSSESASKLSESMNMAATSIMSTMAESASSYKTIELACMVLSAIPLIIIYPFAQKFFEKGVMVGSVKG